MSDSKKRFEHVETSAASGSDPTAHAAPFRRKVETGKGPLEFFRKLGFRRKVEIPGHEREPDRVPEPPPPPPEPKIEVEDPTDKAIPRPPSSRELPRAKVESPTLKRTRSELSRLSGDLERVTQEGAPPLKDLSWTRPEGQKPSVAGGLLKILGGGALFLLALLPIIGPDVFRLFGNHPGIFLILIIAGIAASVFNQNRWR